MSAKQMQVLLWAVGERRLRRISDGAAPSVTRPVLFSTRAFGISGASASLVPGHAPGFFTEWQPSDIAVDGPSSR